MPRNIMSIGRIMYSKMPTKRKLSDFYGFGLPSIAQKHCWEEAQCWLEFDDLDLIFKVTSP